MAIPLSQAFSQVYAAQQSEAKYTPNPPWRSIARPEQVRPEGCDTLILQGGRGSGKTRAIVEDYLEIMRSKQGTMMHMLAPTREDVQKTLIEHPESGLLRCAKRGEVVRYNKNSLEIEFANGVISRGFSGQEPDRLNGPQCTHLLVDEYWAVPIAAIDQALFGLRIGTKTSSAWGSTPKSTDSTRYVLGFMDRKPGDEDEETGFGNVVVHRMRMSDNIENLAREFVARMKKLYAGTKHERVEIEGEMEIDVEGALWRHENFTFPGFRRKVYVPGSEREWGQANGSEIIYIVVAVDPTVSDPALKKNPYKSLDECGIIVAGMDREGRGYVLADLSVRTDPTGWARVALSAYNMFRANCIVYEANQGGELIRQLFKTLSPNATVKAVHASQGKRARAEPVHSLYEQGRFHHCNDTSHMVEMLQREMSPAKRDEIREAIRKTDASFEALEKEMLTWDARDPSIPSPNRLDSLCWAAHGLRLVTVTGTRRRSMRK